MAGRLSLWPASSFEDDGVKQTSMPNPWHSLTLEQALSKAHVSSTRGLSDQEAAKRLRTYGPNRLEERSGPSPLALLLKQFTDFMVVVLIAAAIISFLLGERIDATAILAIVALNALFGFFQEYKAERSLSALREMTAPQTTVKRNGKLKVLKATELVPGDIIHLKEGDRIPADARLLAQSSLAVDESALTGESVPVRKDATWVGDPKTELAERRNMLYMGTSVARGRAEAVVVATGMNTEIGDIAALIKDVGDEQTPLQRRLEQLGRWLVVACLAIVGLVFAAGLLQGLPFYSMFLTGVSLAVAAIPEGLPAVVTVALALGVQKMIRRNAIVRKLPAVETLGCATVICSDKTGTLTQNQMTVTRIVLPTSEIEVTGNDYDVDGRFLADGKEIDPDPNSDLGMALLIQGLCNDATVIEARRGKSAVQISGDPTEAALLVCAYKGGPAVRAAIKGAERLGELPFDSDRKRMSVVARVGDSRLVLVKGAPDVILARCTHVRRMGRVAPMSPADRGHALKAAERCADGALRVLALAYREAKPGDERAGERDVGDDRVESDLVFVGLSAMMDPPRPEVARAIFLAKRAGIETKVVTGDHPKTAEAIAAKLGLGRTRAITGRELDEMSDEEMDRAVREGTVFARVSPRHKLRIVRALKKQGEVVAMTGDGVNDAPAVKEADIGVAMGKSGTDVTREASSMVLADDNFATIVSAIEEGRGIYDNVRKFIRYLLACNTGEVLAMFFAALLGWPLPLLPIQILWVNLVTDGLPAIALGVDPTDKLAMARPPRRPSEGVFTRGLHIKIAVRGCLIAVCTIVAFAVGIMIGPQGDANIAYARTLAFCTLVASQLIYVFQCRSEYKSLPEIGIFGNKWLVLAVAASFGMQLAAVYWQPAAAIFETVPLSGLDWIIVFALSGWSQALESTLITLRRAVLKRISLLRV